MLEEVAKLWKSEAGGVIVEEGEKLKTILKTLEGCMSGGRVGLVRTSSSNLSRQSSFAFGNDSAVDLSSDGGLRRPSLDDARTSSFGISKLLVEENHDDEHEDANKDSRAWLKVISAFDQPRFSYDMEKKHFVPIQSKPSMFPPPSHKTAIFRERYNMIYQRLLRNEAFQAPSFSAAAQTTTSRTAPGQQASSFYRITPISNLLGRGGTSHLLLGKLVIAPTGTLALNDPSGSIFLSVEHASALQGEDSSYFCPGMIVLVDGVYEEDWAGAGSSGLGNTGGVGGTIGGRFVGFSLGGPPVEKRNVSLGVNLSGNDMGGGFGWTDFLGLGSERAVGGRMKRLEKRLLGPQSETAGGEGRRKMVILSEVTLDQPATLAALRKVLETYSTAASEPPLCWLLCGNFISHAAMAGASIDSIAYKEAFNDLAALLSDFPSLLRRSTWVFVPGDNDPWASAFSAGASTLIPREGVPEIFTSRIKRVFASARSEGPRREGEIDGDALWTSNPTRLSLFGPAHEVVVFRDEVEGRFRRSAVRVGQAASRESRRRQQQLQQQENGETQAAAAEEDIVISGALPSTEDATADTPAAEDSGMSLDKPSTPDSPSLTAAKKLILSLLPQSTLSPFPLSLRPTHWDHTSSALSLYPLPHTLVLADPEMEAYSVTFEGCHVVNPGRLVGGSGNGKGGRRKWVGWVEYDVWTRRGEVRGEWVG